jgi:uncharacterized membrane protein YbaN (DUF454 family)
VNSQQAKEILMLYRADDANAHDPQLAEALSLAQSNPELGHWFEQHCALQATIRDKFRQITVPEGLKEQLLAEYTSRRKIIWWRQPAILAAAAAIVLLIGLAVFWLQPREENGFFGFRSRMVSTALRSYSMDLETNDLKQIRAFLANNSALSNYVLPPVLEKTHGSGCKILTWQGKRVSMVCFNSGRPLAPGVKSDLFLFVIDRSSLPDAPPANKPLINKVNQLMTASWNLGDKVYVLGGFGDEDFIRKYL